MWRNLGGGRFENITEKAGVALKTRVCVAASFADVDNDGKPDLFVTSVRNGNVLFHNLGNGRSEDVSHSARLDYSGHSSGAVFCDFNRDGLLISSSAMSDITRPMKKEAMELIRRSLTPFRDTPTASGPSKSIYISTKVVLKFRDVSAEMLSHQGWSGSELCRREWRWISGPVCLEHVWPGSPLHKR